MSEEKPYCIVTGVLGEYHHVRSRGARIDLIDEDWNLMPVCRFLHSKIHSKGLSWAAEYYPAIKRWLLKNGWELLVYNKSSKWIHHMESKSK